LLGKGTVHRGVPVTAVPATLVRLSSLLSFDELARAAHEAAVRYGITAVDDAPRRLKAILEGDAPVLLSRLGRGFRARQRAADLPLPVTNRPAGAHYVDCRWVVHGLIVELDSYRFHRSRHAWEQDRRRFKEPDQMLAELRDILLARRPP
jgi:hypothetical protein